MLAIVGLAMALVVAVAMGTFFKQRGVKMLTAMVEAAASSSDSTDAIAQETSAQGHDFVGKDAPLARLLELAGRLGVKGRILISLAQVSSGSARCARTAAERGRHHLLSGRGCSQVLSQVTTTYQIDFPDLYSEMLSTFERINIPIKFLPFGCTFPRLDNYMFDLVLQTATPLRAPPNPVNSARWRVGATVPLTLPSAPPIIRNSIARARLIRFGRSCVSLESQC